MSRFARLGGNAQGIVLMLAAIALFSVMDAAAKHIAQSTDTVMAIWARYAGQTVVVGLLVAPRLRRVLRTEYPKLQLLRSVFLLIATSCFFFGFVLIGLANAAAIMALNPVLITAGAAIFLGERFGLRRALGIAAALIGALIIIRPGSGTFSAYAVLPLMAAVAYSGYALATRFVGRDEDTWTSLLYTAAFGGVVLSAVVPFFWVRPDPLTAALMCGLGFIGALGHFCLIRAFTAAEASLIAPFAYAGVMFATIWGMVLFSEYPPWTSYLGMLVIVAAGLYVWHRETRVKPARATS